ncbi:MAG: DPP IV N-terminal domain-containing protein [Syntrophales bacterium]|nr:DPP IV N-terminal domain-containing protein [Syntrophales bacterium]
MGKPVLVRTPAGGVGMTFISPSALGDYDSQPDVSPDGSMIAFLTVLGGTYNLCTVDSNGGNFTVYAEGASPRWHPTEKLLAFDRSVGKKSQCFLFNLNSGQVTQLTSGTDKNVFPVWSPDGKWIAFLSDRDGEMHVYCMKRDGGHVVQLTTGGTNENFIDWGTDGYLYFTSDAGASTATEGNKSWYYNFANIWRLKPLLDE